MAGPGIRSFNFARELAHDFEVTLAVPVEPDLELPGVRIAIAPPRDARTATALVQEHDAVVAQRLPPHTMLAATRSATRVVYDLYAPVLLEDLAHGDARTLPVGLVRERERLVERLVMLTGDAFVCASERQRDFYLGALSAAGRLTPADYKSDPSLRELVDVVPFGIDPTPPVRSSNGLRKSVPGVEPDDVVLLWGGGVWNWFDPLTVIKAVAELAQTRPQLRLVFLGTRHPNPEIEEMAMTRSALELATELGLRNRAVLFNESWVPYEERGAWLMDADVGVSAHFDDVETRFSFRTRLLDCVWAGLPTVSTKGDDLGEQIARSGGGHAVPVGDVDAWVRALTQLVDHEQSRSEARRALEPLRAAFAWPHVVERLAELLEPPGRPRSVDRSTRLLAERERAVRARMSLALRGPAGVLQHRARRRLT